MAEVLLEQQHLHLIREVQVGDRRGGDSEDSQHDCRDAGLEADEDGKAAEQFDQADKDGRDRRHRQADAAEPAGSAGNRGELAEAGKDEMRRQGGCGRRE